MVNQSLQTYHHLPRLHQGEPQNMARKELHPRRTNFLPFHPPSRSINQYIIYVTVIILEILNHLCISVTSYMPWS